MKINKEELHPSNTLIVGFKGLRCSLGESSPYQSPLASTLSNRQGM